MTKVVTAKDAHRIGEQVFGKKLKALDAKVNALARKVNELQRMMGRVPVDAEVIEEGSVLTKKKELKDASSSKREKDS